MAKIPVPLEFDWDEGNADKNALKHKVTNRESEEVFLNRPLKIFEDPRHSEKEQRYVAYGTTNENRKLTVVFTARKQKIRIISARDQNKKERMKYEA